MNKEPDQHEKQPEIPDYVRSPDYRRVLSSHKETDRSKQDAD